MAPPVSLSNAETWLDPAAQREAEELLRKRCNELGYWNVEESVAASMNLRWPRERFVYLRGVVPPGTFAPGARALVSGCEAGGEMIVARESGFGPVLGVDVDPFLVEVAKRRLAGLEGFDCRLYGGGTLPFEDGSFDLVVSGHVIEHTADPDSYLSELLRVLRVGGHLFLEFPTRFNRRELHTRLPSVEWAPEPLRTLALRLFASRVSPFGPEARRRYGTILDTKLRAVSLPQVRLWIARSPRRARLLDATRTPPGVIRTVFRRRS